jgi:PhoPQ-activated pathogenicity-related protein
MERVMRQFYPAPLAAGETSFGIHRLAHRPPKPGRCIGRDNVPINTATPSLWTIQRRAVGLSLIHESNTAELKDRVMHRPLPIGLLLLSLATTPLPAEDRAAQAVPDALQRYVAREEPVFACELLESQSTDFGSILRYELTSQTWQGIVWKHAILVYVPAVVEHPRHMLLMVTGGKTGRVPGTGDRATGMLLAQRCGARVAVLHQVPNQPLLGDHVEDDLITETWLKYLETGDESWPLLFPMVKSAVKAMDALQEISRTEWEEPVEGFVITGASKRGWTSWLTPVADSRVIATAPMVIDMLNFEAQMQHQMAVWGKFSEQIDDYTRKGLVKGADEPRTDRELALARMMDPYTYREQLTLPKLLVCGTNDRYWVVDAMGNYWNDLRGPKHILYIPNAGHDLKGGHDQVISTIAVCFRHAATGRLFPQVDWSFTAGDHLHLNVTCDAAPVAVRLWTTTSATTDFRDSVWSAESISGAEGTFSAAVPRTDSGHQAVFAELQFHDHGLDYSLTTQVFTTVPGAE